VITGKVGKGQQLTIATITITPNTTNRNLTDRVFITTAGLTPRAAIIKLKISETLTICVPSPDHAPTGHRPVATGIALRDVIGE
jgi:hypothetical protein